ncbi:hypothetical protein [Dactylosporangium salmoneum]
MIQPTWENVCQVIRDDHADDLYAIADALGQEPQESDDVEAFVP